MENEGKKRKENNLVKNQQKGNAGTTSKESDNRVPSDEDSRVCIINTARQSSKSSDNMTNSAADSGIFDESLSCEKDDDQKNKEEFAKLKRPTDGEPQTSSHVLFKKLKKAHRKVYHRTRQENDSDSDNDNTNGMEVSDSSSDSSHSSDDLSGSSHSDSSNDSENNNTNKELSDDELWLKKEVTNLVKNNWVVCKEFIAREYGIHPRKFIQKTYSSRHMVRKLKRMHCLTDHEGCVNSLHFNESGSLLASGSDDLMINIWDWKTPGKPKVSYNSGHRSNVFQSKFLPGCNDVTVVSCARDGQVRVADISSTGSCRAIKKVVQHRGSAHKLALDTCGNKTLFYSCGEDGCVYRIDLRKEEPSEKILCVRTSSNKIPLYSIHANPVKEYEFAVSGRDEWSRLYDQRMISSTDDMPMKRYCPYHLMKPAKSVTKANVTCLMYNYDGTELLSSYNDEDIYLFDITHSSGDEYKRKYKGHRNNATVKGVNFYGPNSEYIVSGSDCGNIFLWEKSSSQIVQFMEGDQGGVVNVLEPHPHFPVLATSGLDNDIKIFSPIGQADEKMPDLKETMISNRHERHEDASTNPMDGQLLWFLMRSLQTNRRQWQRRSQGERRSSATAALSDDSSMDSNSSDGDSDEQEYPDPCLTS